MAGGPNKVSCKNSSYTSGISMHYFPKDEAVRKKWTDFVRRHRKDFVPSQKSCLCSAHFDQNSYESRPILFPDVPDIQSPTFKRYLIKGSFPTKDVAGGTTEMSVTQPSARQRRQVFVNSNAIININSYMQTNIISNSR